jgi:hypothetical protein
MVGVGGGRKVIRFPGTFGTHAGYFGRAAKKIHAGPHPLELGKPCPVPKTVILNARMQNRVAIGDALSFDSIQELVPSRSWKCKNSVHIHFRPRLASTYFWSIERILQFLEILKYQIF